MGKAAYLLAHDQEREKIAYAGQKKRWLSTRFTIKPND